MRTPLTVVFAAGVAGFLGCSHGGGGSGPPPLPAGDGGQDLAVSTGLDGGPADLSARGPAGDGGVQNVGVHVFVSDTCAVTFMPPSFGVTAGTGFTVNWINDDTSLQPVDIAAIGVPPGTVPIKTGLNPGDNYHDTVHTWCGTFRGTFKFQASCDKVSTDMPIDCSKP